MATILEQLQQIRDERKLYANTATRVGNALIALLSLIEEGQDKWLSKVSPDTAQQLITFAKGISVSGGIEADNANIAKLAADTHTSATTYEGVQTFLRQTIAAAIQTADFDEATQQGYSLAPMDNGKYKLMLTNLEVWGKAIFNELEIRKLSYVGGNIVLSPAGSKLVSVEPQYATPDLQTPTAYRCYLLADDGTTATQNTWAVGDQAKCQTFNIGEGTTQSAANRYYWRLVTAVSTQPEQILSPITQQPLYDGQRFHWIELSPTDYDTTSTDTPEAGDTIVQMGNRTDPDRQNLIVLYTAGAQLAPYIAAYKGVSGYYLNAKQLVFQLSPSGVKFNSSSFEWVGSDGEPIGVKNYRGEWQASATPYLYYDEVTYQGQIWLCVTGDEQGTSEPPSEDSTAWMLEVAKGDTGEKGDTGDSSLHLEITGDQTFLALGEKTTINARLFYGTQLVDTSEGWTWHVTRSSGNSEADERWNAQAKATAFEGQLTIEHLNADNDDDDLNAATVDYKITVTKDDPDTPPQLVSPDSTDAEAPGTRYASVALNSISDAKIAALFQ